MRKMSFGIACVATLVAVSMTSAGTINLWTASTCGGESVGGAPGFNATPGNTTVWLAPTDQNATLATRYGVSAAALAYDTAVLYIMGDVACRGGSGNGQETIASLGLNIRKAGTGPDSGALSATGWSISNTGGNGATGTGSQNNPWSGTNNGTVTLNAAGNLLVQNARAVAVPASTGDSLWRGYTVNTGSGSLTCGTGGSYSVNGTDGHYRMASLTLAAGTTGSTATHLPTSFNLFMQVGALKIARVYSPTGNNGGAPESVAFGYVGASPENPATPNGSTVGAESATADAVVIIRRKGDFGSSDPNTGNSIPVPDGQVGSDDTPFFLAAFGSTVPEKIFLGDFASSDANTGNSIPVRDCQVGSDDTPFFLQAFGS